MSVLPKTVGFLCLLICNKWVSFLHFIVYFSELCPRWLVAERRFTEEQLCNCVTNRVNKHACNSIVNPPVLSLSLFHDILTPFHMSNNNMSSSAGTGTLIVDLSFLHCLFVLVFSAFKRGWFRTLYRPTSDVFRPSGVFSCLCFAWSSHDVALNRVKPVCSNGTS